MGNENTGINNFLRNYIKLKTSDHVIISFWYECRIEAELLASHIEAWGASAEMHSFFSHDETLYALELDGLLRKMANKHIVLLVCQTQKQSFTPYLKSLVTHPKLSVWRMLNTSEKLFSLTTLVNPENIVTVNNKIITAIQTNNQQEMIYEDDHGSKLRIKLNNEKHKIKNKNGIPDENDFITLPIGEISTYPSNITGVFVTVGALHSNHLLPFDCRLNGSRIVFKIEDNIIHQLECDNRRIESFLTQIFSHDYVKKIDEFSIGTNYGVKYFISANSHINERHPGVHLGVGLHQSSKDKTSSSNFHIDFINPYGKLKFENGQTIDLNRLTSLLTSSSIPENNSFG